MQGGNEDYLTRRVNFLRQVRLFSGMGEKELRLLASQFRVRRCRGRQIIFHQGDESNVIYLIASGTVRVFTTSPAGNETTVRIYSRGQLIGEFAAIDDSTRSASAESLGDCTVLELGQDRFLRFIHEIPELAMEMIKALVEKLRWTTDFAESLAQYDIPGRLLHILIQYAQILGREIEPGRRYELKLPINQVDLSSMVGARRESVNRLLQDWKRQGLVEYARGRVTIVNLPAAKAERDRRIQLYDEDVRQ